MPTLIERRGPVVRMRTPDGGWRTLVDGVEGFDTMLSELADPEAAPELLTLRHRIRGWRFYDQFRTDALAPARAARIGTRTPVLDSDGGHLAAAPQTIREVGDDAAEAMDRAVDDAFPGSRVEIVQEGGRFELLVLQPGLLRPLRPSELSDAPLPPLDGCPADAASPLVPRPQRAREQPPSGPSSRPGRPHRHRRRTDSGGRGVALRPPPLGADRALGSRRPRPQRDRADQGAGSDAAGWPVRDGRVPLALAIALRRTTATDQSCQRRRCRASAFAILVRGLDSGVR